MRTKAVFICAMWLLTFVSFGTCVQRQVSSVPDVPDFPNNPGTEAGILLGKALFFSPELSQNGRIACATCHQPERAFSDGLALSTLGHSQRPLERHTPALFNLAWQPHFFTDGGVKNLESLPAAPIQHPDEMAQDLALLTKKLQKNAFWPPLFVKAFGQDSITVKLIFRALAQYQRSLLSFNAPYDSVEAGLRAFTPQELRGRALFDKSCSVCHRPPLFTDFDFHNNGLDTAFSAESERIQWGRGRITNQTDDIGKYKTPSLRNWRWTAPYMHDGRFKNLEEVLSHYQHGIKKSASLSKKLPLPKNNVSLELSAQNKKDLIAFLNTLNDETFLKQHSATRTD